VKKIIIDTNFLLIPYQFKVDIFSEIKRICDFKYRLCIIDKTLEEMKKIIATQKEKHRRAAVLGVMLLGQKNVYKIRAKKGKSVDESILEIACKDKKGYVVATQDAELKRKLKEKGISLIVLKGKSHLELVAA